MYIRGIEYFVFVFNIFRLNLGTVPTVSYFVFFFLFLRDRPFNLQGRLWGFFFVQKFFSDNTRVRIFFFQNLILGYMTKILNQIFFFFHQNQNIFFSNIGNQKFFLEKNHNPPFKLNGRSLISCQKPGMDRNYCLIVFIVYMSYSDT